MAPASFPPQPRPAAAALSSAEPVTAGGWWHQLMFGCEAHGFRTAGRLARGPADPADPASHCSGGGERGHLTPSQPLHREKLRHRAEHEAQLQGPPMGPILISLHPSWLPCVPCTAKPRISPVDAADQRPRLSSGAALLSLKPGPDCRLPACPQVTPGLSGPARPLPHPSPILSRPRDPQVGPASWQCLSLTPGSPISSFSPRGFLRPVTDPDLP